MKIGLIIQKLRTTANMTQEELAEELFVSRELVSKWENGTRQPDYPAILRISEKFNIRTDYLLSYGNTALNELLSLVNEAEGLTQEIFTDKLNAFLRSIQESDRNIFIRRYYYFEDTKAIAEKYGIKDGTVRSSLSRTRKKLKKYLSEGSDNEKGRII